MRSLCTKSLSAALSTFLDPCPYPSQALPNELDAPSDSGALFQSLRRNQHYDMSRGKLPRDLLAGGRQLMQELPHVRAHQRERVCVCVFDTVCAWCHSY